MPSDAASPQGSTAGTAELVDKLTARVARLEHRQAVAERVIDAFAGGLFDFAEEALNGQQGRRALIEDLFARIGFAAVVETGTYFGATAGYLASRYGVPVDTVELVPRYAMAARRLLRHVPGVTVHHRDSRALLAQLAARADLPSPTLFYLDAHWYRDLPLAEELDVIAAAWSDWVAVIDDFQVPDDPGYGFDDYGDHGRLTLEYLGPVLERHGLAALYPALASELETGTRQGSLITACPSLAQAVSASELLRTVPANRTSG